MNNAIGQTAKVVERAKEIIAYYNQLLADMDYSAELYQQDYDLAEAFLAAIKDAERYRWLRSGGAETIFLKEQASFMSHGQLIHVKQIGWTELNAAIDASMNAVIEGKVDGS